MEDRNPFMPVESTFSASENIEEAENNQEKKGKKKKSRLTEWLSKFIRPNVETDNSPEGEEKRSRTKRVAEVLSGIFSRATGVEKHELPEEDTEKTDEFRRSLYFPLTTEIRHNDDRYGSDTEATSTHVEGADASIETGAHEDDESSRSSESIFDKNISADYQATVHNQPEQSSDVDEQPAEVYQQNDLDIQAKVSEQHFAAERTSNQNATIVKEKETVIERGGGGGAALLGFVAAETLSRSRDAKIRKEAEALKKQVHNLEHQQTHQTIDLNEVRDKNREQVEALRKRRHIPQTQGEVIIDHDARTALEESSAIRETVVFERPEQKYAPRIELRQNRPASDESVTPTQNKVHKELSQDEALVLEQVEKAAEQDIPLEAYYEKRHEVKDVPTSSGNSGGPQSNNGDNAGRHSGSNDNYTLPEPQNGRPVPPQLPTSMYTQAAKQGVYVGLLLIVAFLVIIFVWSLL